MTNKEKYYQIINTGLKDKPEIGYYEHHHIIPKSICPLLKNSKQNLVYLTAKNHFLAHYYIYHWFNDELKDRKWARSMCYAFNMMKRIITKSDNVDELSKLYEEVRKDLNEANKNPSEQTRRKISETLKKPILQYSKDGNFIKEWKSAKDAGDVLGIEHSNISRCCFGKRKSAGGFVWKYKKEKTDK